MYSSPSVSRFVRFIPSFQVIFYSSKRTLGFSKNADDPHKRTNMDQNNTAKHEVAEQDCRTELEKEPESAENSSKGAKHSLGFKGRLGFEETRNGCSGIKEERPALIEGLNESSVSMQFEESSDGFYESGFERSGDGFRGLGFQEGTDGSQGIEDNLGFVEKINGCQGSNGSLGDGENSNGFQGFKDRYVSRKDYNGSQGFEDMKNGSRGFVENSNRSPGFGDNVDGFSWFEENPNYFFSDLRENDSEKSCGSGSKGFSSSRRFKYEAKLLYKILQRDEPGFDVNEALQQTGFRMTALLVRSVLMMILSTVDKATISRSAKLGFKFFLWASQQDGYKHSPETYNLLVKIFAVCGELKAMWRLVDEMRKIQCPITARTFNILLCRSRKAGMPRKVVEMFIRSKDFNYRPYKHSFNAILHVLLKEKHLNLIEWVHEEMLKDGHSADILTYNIMIYAKHRLGKHNDFNQLLQEMVTNGFAPDLHTYNILLHVLGKGDKPDKALDLLNYMREVGCHPQVTHFTALIDGLGRAGNLVACKYIFEEMSKMGCKPDVVCYTVMIIGFAVACELEKAQTLFDEMIHRGQLPNEYTYNAMILGLCNVGRYEEACGMLEVMESRDCYPDFVIYRTLVRELRKARKFSQAQEILNEMDENGRYSHLVTKLKKYCK